MSLVLWSSPASNAKPDISQAFPRLFLLRVLELVFHLSVGRAMLGSGTPVHRWR